MLGTISNEQIAITGENGIGLRFSANLF